MHTLPKAPKVRGILWKKCWVFFGKSEGYTLEEVSYQTDELTNGKRGAEAMICGKGVFERISIDGNIEKQEHRNSVQVNGRNFTIFFYVCPILPCFALLYPVLRCFERFCPDFNVLHLILHCDGFDKPVVNSKYKLALHVFKFYMK